MVKMNIVFVLYVIVGIHGQDSASIDQADKLLYNDPINESKLDRQKRQSTENDTSTSSTSSNTNAYPPLINISQPIFFPEVVVPGFQLQLNSSSSIVVIIGSDYNLYLSDQDLSGTTASTFNLIDLGLSNNSYTFLIQDSQTQRYLHSYNDIQANGYSRVRTNPVSYLPCTANLIFWTFVRGYLQFFRGGEWFYDTVGCLDPTTGLVKLWLVNGQQGLTAIQSIYGNCGLAQLVGFTND